MNVTSVLSSGYLQPSKNAVPTANEAPNLSSELAKEEARILAQEQALKTASGPDAKVSTVYHYSAGPDGRRYITGAEVSVKKGGEDDKHNGQSHGGESPKASSASPDEGSESEAVRELQNIEREVVSHEAAHQAAGGALAGSVTYTYTQGPDGKSYITGGEVPIQMPTNSGNPEETLRNMAQVQRAALAPGNPSAQDLGVAGRAAAAAAKARQEIASKNGISGENDGNEYSSGVSSVRAGMLFDRINGDEAGAQPVIAEELPNASMIDPRDAYGHNASKRGLWALGRGFASAASRIPRVGPRFEIAA